MSRTARTMRTGTQGVFQPTTLPSVREKLSATRATVMSVAPTQSTAGKRFLDAVPGEGEGSESECVGGGGGMRNIPATVMMEERMASAPNTHFQLAYSAIRPERRLPQTLPRGAPAPAGY